MKDLLNLPIDASLHGPGVDQIIVITHWLMAVLFVGWGAFFIYSLIRFRKKRNPKADYIGVKTHASSYIEVAVGLFEGVLLVGFAIPVWSNVWTKYPAEKDATVIHIVAEQFAWNAHYAGPDGKFGRRDIKLVSADNPLGLDRSDPNAKDDITTINQIHFPINKPVLIYLTTKDVIHSFGIPLLRVKQDAIPGQTIPVTFTATMTNAQVREKLEHGLPISAGHIPPYLTSYIAFADYKTKDGLTILSKGDAISEDAIAKLLEAGYSSVEVSQDTPVEVACAQLCGLGHYRMRATVTLDSEADFQKWLNEEAQYLEQ